METILGIHPGHDATAALVQAGQVVAAVGEERLSRIKGHLGFPFRAVAEVLRLGRLRPDQVDLVAFTFNDYLNASPYFTRLILDPAGGAIDLANELPLTARWAMCRREWDVWLRGVHRTGRAWRQTTRRLYRDALDRLGLVCPYRSIEHHHAHAASAYYTAGYREGLVLTGDGSGDGLSATISLGRAGRIERIAQSAGQVSPGSFYAAVTRYLGFKRHRHEGKVTGLAAHGDPGPAYEILARCFGFDADRLCFTTGLGNGQRPGGPSLRTGLRMLRGKRFWGADTNRLLAYFDKKLAGIGREDVAAAVQKRLEDCWLAMLAAVEARHGVQPLVMAGGTFANVRLNQKLMEHGKGRPIYVYPNMGDGGTAAGAALAVRADAAGIDPAPLAHVYLGSGASEADMRAALENAGLVYEYCDPVEPRVAAEVAGGKVVARFDGAMEYGPRALGNRSILVKPTDPTVNRWLNRRLRRTEFMPFAPAVLAEEADAYFHNTASARLPGRFMTVTLAATGLCRQKAPAVVHVDGTARPQLVTRDANPGFHRVLRAYQRLTGLPLMINTSFNMHEEPIVCSAKDAVRCFLKGHLDVLALGPFIVLNPNGRNPNKEF